MWGRGVSRSEWYSDHEFHVLVDVFGAVAPVAVVVDGFAEAGGEGAFGGGEFEGENEVGDLLEVLPHRVDLVDDVFQTDDVAAQVLLHLRVGLDLHSFLPHLPVQLLVDQLAHQFLGGLSPGDVVLHPLQQADVGGGALDEGRSVDRPEVEFGEDDLLLLGDVGDTPDPDDEEKFADAVDVPMFSVEDELLVLLALSGEGGTLRR